MISGWPPRRHSFFVAADAVQQIEHGIFRVGGIAGRRIDERLAFVADGFRIVFDHLQLAVRDAFARFVEAFRRIWERRFVVGLQLNRTAESAAAALRPAAGAGAARRLLAFGDDLFVAPKSPTLRVNLISLPEIVPV